jgi:hypothetical protein
MNTNYTIIASFFIPEYLRNKTNSSSLIASTFFVENESLPINPITNNNINDNLELLDASEYSVIVVSPDYVASNDADFKFHPNNNIRVSWARHDVFFSDSFLNTWYKSFVSEWQYDSHFIFIFQDTTWEYVVNRFNKLGIEIIEIDSKNSHLLLPSQSRLSVFLSAVFGKKHLESTFGKDNLPKIHSINPGNTEFIDSDDTNDEK